MREVLLVTGSSGIAAATARMWGAENPVFVVSNDQDQCRQVTAEIKESSFAVADIRDEVEVRKGVAACLNRFGRIDALFNVAGVSGRSEGDGALHKCKSEAWDLVMDVNAKGTFLMCREVLAVWMKNSQAGVVLNCGSVLAQRPERNHFSTIGYAASKGAIESMTKSAAAFYAPMGIRLNVIAPGLVRTPMSARAQSDPRIMEYIAHKQPLSKGMLSAVDVAKMACFLLRKDSTPMTGQVVTVDGGWTVSE